MALAVEFLDALVAHIGHIHLTLGIHADPGRSIKLARLSARLSPGHKELSGRPELRHPLVGAIGYIDLALVVYRHRLKYLGSGFFPFYIAQGGDIPESG